MASSLQLHKDWQRKVEEVRQLNAELSLRRAELSETDTLLTKYRAEHETKLKGMDEREADLRTREGDVRVALSRTEATIQANIEALNTEILDRKAALAALDADIQDRARALAKANSALLSTQDDGKKAMARLNGLHGDIEKAQEGLSDAKNGLVEVQEAIAVARAELEMVRAESAHLQALKRDLDMYHQRIRNYYRRAGLHLIDKKHVGIPSN